MKRFTIFLFLLATIAQAQNLKIKGKIIDNTTKEALPGANIKLLKTNQETQTNQEGNFEMTGEGMLEISFSGYQVIQIKSSSNLIIELEPNENQLQEVEIMGRKKNDYDSEYSFSATKTAIPNKLLPQGIGTVTKELIADRQAFQLADAVKVISSVSSPSFYNQFNIRGITQNEMGAIVNGMRTRNIYFIQPLTSNIERVEVIKGPASATFSSVDPGGSVNLVTKKPLDHDKKEVTFSAGSFSTLRTTLDFTGPLNESKTLLYRLNGAYQEAKSFRDLVNNNSFLVSPSLTYKPNNKTSVNVEMTLSSLSGNLDRGQPIFGAIAGKTRLDTTPINLNLGAANDFYKTDELILTTTLSHKLTDKISFNAQYMKQTWEEDLLEHRTTNTFARDINNNPVNSLAQMRLDQRKQKWNIDNINAYFNFDFKIGKVENKLLIGYDLHSWQKIIGGGVNSARGFLKKDGTVTNTFVLANAADYQTVTVGGVVLPKPNVNYFDLNNPTYTLRNVNDYNFNSRTIIPATLTTTHSAYIQDQIKIGQLFLLLSVRQEWFKDVMNHNTKTESSFKNTALIPRLGATYSITENINVYATYLKGFQPQSNTVGSMPATDNFFNSGTSVAIYKPLESELAEIGFKSEFFNKRLSATASVYQIIQKNVLMNANDPLDPNLLIQRGQDRSKGFEMDVVGKVTSDLQIMASYSYIDAIIQDDTNPTLIGKRKENAPQNSANLWARYNLTQIKALKDLGLGFGIQNQGSRIPWYTRDFEVPEFTVFDAAVYYTPSKSSIQLALNVNNVFNKTYWTGAQTYFRLFPGAPRNMMLTATYKF